MCMPVTPAVPYLLLDLQDVQWAVGNSRGVRKLTRTPHVNNKKKIILSIKCASSFKFNILPRNLHHCLPNYQLICPWSYRPTAHYCWSYASDIVFTYPSHPGGPGLVVRVNYTVAQEPADQSKKKKSKHGMKCNDSLEGRSTQ